jgi:hypothetical protein
MPCEDEGSAKFKIHSRTTYCNKLWQFLEWLDLSITSNTLLVYKFLLAKYGPDPFLVHDIMAWGRCKGVILICCYDPFEIIFADKGYQGLDGCLMPFKGKYNLMLFNLKGSS